MNRNQLFGWILALAGIAVSGWRALEYKRARTAVVINESAEPETPYAAGTSALEAGDFGRAIRLLNLAVVQDPRDAAAWNNLGRSFMALDSVPQAATAFEHALEADSSDPFAGSNLGAIHIRNREWTRAIPVLRAHLERHPDDSEAKYKLAVAYTQTGAWTRAVPLFREVVDEFDDEGEVHGMFGFALAQIGDIDEATRQLQRSIELDDREHDRVRLINILALNSRVPEATEEARRFIARDRENPTAWQLLANIRFIADDFRGSREAFEELLRIEPEWMASHQADRTRWNQVRLSDR